MVASNTNDFLPIISEEARRDGAFVAGVLTTCATTGIWPGWVLTTRELLHKEYILQLATQHYLEGRGLPEAVEAIRRVGEAIFAKVVEAKQPVYEGKQP